MAITQPHGVGVAASLFSQRPLSSSSNGGKPGFTTTEGKLERKEEEYDVDAAGKKAGPVGLCRTEELCLHPKGHGTEMGAQQ